MSDIKVAILGLGYVGLPLAIELSRHFPVVAYDLDKLRISELCDHHDSTREVSSEYLKNAGDIIFTTKEGKLADSNVYVITVPTPVDRYKIPNLKSLEDATTMVASVLKAGNTVIYESSVYPGATEEVCVPILQQHSGLVFNEDFFVCYSPERINPGDKQQSLVNTVKVTAGSTPETAEFVDSIYQKIVTVGTHRVSSIKVAEAAKIIENTQRDLNIALINELAIIFNILEIDTEEVIQAAGSKWNFIEFHPGLVGGHCIGVDPYYLTHKARQVGYIPKVILAGRSINDSMGAYVAQQFVKLMLERGLNLANSRILILGLTFKENCSDIRNTRVVDIIDSLKEYSIEADVFDPWVKPGDARKLGTVNLIEKIERQTYSGIIVAVKHAEFIELGIEKLRQCCVENAPIYDLKSTFAKELTDKRL